jgi:hypothetical protein
VSAIGIYFRDFRPITSDSLSPAYGALARSVCLPMRAAMNTQPGPRRVWLTWYLQLEQRVAVPFRDALAGRQPLPQQAPHLLAAAWGDLHHLQRGTTWIIGLKRAKRAYQNSRSNQLCTLLAVVASHQKHNPLR